MVDYATELEKGLATVLPTYAEPVEASGTPVPCITYAETNRRDLQAVNGLQYSEIQVRVRVWTTGRKEMQRYADSAETVLRRMGWAIIGSGELAANGRFCKVLTCEATGRENKKW